MLTKSADSPLNTMASTLSACVAYGVAAASVGTSVAGGMMHVASWWWHHVHVRVLFSVLLKHPARYCNA